MCFAVVEQNSIGFVERFGKFVRTARPGLNFVLCCIGERVAGRLTLRIQQLHVSVETKTKDNVFVTVVVSVQYKAIDAQAYDAFYKLSDPTGQIRSYVFDTVRSAVPRILLDDVFEVKDDIAKAVKDNLQKTIGDFGYFIVEALVTDIEPDAKVKASMNEINAAQRLRVAAADKAEAEKIIVVKAAEADAEAKHLSGIGIARQREAIVAGLRDSVAGFSEQVPGVTSHDVIELMLTTQYFDTLKDLGNQSKSHTVFIPSDPATVQSVTSQIRQGLMQANADQRH